MLFDTIIKLLAGLMIAALIGFGAYFSFNIFLWDNVYEEIPVEPKKITIVNQNTGNETEVIYNKTEIASGDPFVVLLLGIDSNNVTQGRSDTIILAIVEPQEKKINLLSVPRDTFMPMADSGKNDKVNHAQIKGVSNTVATLEQFFNIPIDYYASVSFQGLIDTVDTIGGLDIDVEKNITFHDRLSNQYFSLAAGNQSLNGEQTLNYARFRGDAEGDFGRNRRQRQVISELIRQTVDFQNVSKASQLLGVLEENLRTNIKPLEIGALLKQVGLGTAISVEEIPMSAKPATHNGMSIVIVEEEEKENVIQLLHNKLKLSAIN